MQTLDQLGAKADQANTKLDQLDAKAEKRIPISDYYVAITEPGSYFLTANIRSPGGGANYGIFIDASNVTLDLNGFAIIGNKPGAGGAGVLMNGDLQNVCVKNGTITGWNAGIKGNATFVPGTVSNSRFENLIVSYNAGVGMDITDESEVRDCVVTHNGGIGINLRHGCRVVHCIASVNDGRGIFGQDNTAVESCTAAFNKQGGIYVHYGSTVMDCTVRSNSGIGIWFSGGSRIVNNTVDLNSDDGFYTSDGTSRIEGNSATFNQNFGFSIVGTANLVVRNSCRGSKNGNYNIPNSVYGNIVSMAPGQIPDTVGPWSNISY